MKSDTFKTGLIGTNTLINGPCTSVGWNVIGLAPVFDHEFKVYFSVWAPAKPATKSEINII